MALEYTNALTVWGRDAAARAAFAEHIASRHPFTLQLAVREPEGRAFPGEDWARAHWGCIGDVIHARMECSSDGMQVVTFTSPGSPPCEAIGSLSQAFPTLNFALSYSCIETGVAGYTCFCGGRPVRDFDDEFIWAEDLDRYAALLAKYQMQEDGSIVRGWPPIAEVSPSVFDDVASSPPGPEAALPSPAAEVPSAYEAAAGGMATD